MATQKKPYKDTRQTGKISYLGKRGILVNGDCLELLSGLKTNSIDLIFTDPPFNVGKDYGTRKVNDNLDAEAYRAWCKQWTLELVRVLRPGGALAIYVYPKIALELGGWLNTLNGLEYKAAIALKMKSGFPIRGRMHPAHYSILYYVKEGAKSTFNVVRNKTPICRHCGKETRDYGGYRSKFSKFEDEHGVPWIQISDFWEDTRPARQDKSRKDINELPIHVAERVILMASKPHDVVLDIFGGGGSTFHAAQIHNRYWIGSEIGSVTPILSRFATLFGRDEEREVPSRLNKCFDKEYLKTVLKKRERKILKAPLLSNGHSLNKEDTLNKSKVLGF
ncbi:MAG: site-specific DNA-methyltransferase [Patescibacteria group bacterium]